MCQKDKRSFAFTIEPYVGAIPIRFGMNPDEVESVLGKPLIKSQNYQKELSFNYNNFNIGFDGSNSAAHIGFTPGAKVQFQGQPVLTEQSLRRLCLLDGNPKEVVGFVVLLSFGIAFAGFHDHDESQKSVSLFAKGGYETLKEKMVDFKTWQ